MLAHMRNQMGFFVWIIVENPYILEFTIVSKSPMLYSYVFANMLKESIAFSAMWDATKVL